MIDVTDQRLIVRVTQDILRDVQNKPQNVLPILRTDTQYELLIELFFESDRARTLSDLARSIGVDQTTVMREVNRLLESGVLVEEKVGRARTVEMNVASPLLGPLRQLMRVAHGPPVEADDLHHLRNHGQQARTERTRHDRRPLPSSRRRP